MNTLKKISLSFLLWPAMQVVADKPQKPNFIFILTDDQGWSSASIGMDKQVTHASSDYYETKNMARLASNGVCFSNAYAPCALSCPTRRGILYGQTPMRQGDDQHFKEHYRPDSHQLTIPAMLKSADPAYNTAHFGKWDIRTGVSPEELGYDESDGNTGNGNGNVFTDKSSKFTDVFLNDDPKRIETLTDRAVGFMQRNVESGHPFYLQISHYAVHVDIQTREATYRKYLNKEKGAIHQHAGWAAMLENLDEGIGRVLDALDSLGIADHTYVILMSDNGGVEAIPQIKNKFAHPSQLPPSLNFPLRAGKWTLYEGGIRVPFIVAGPGIKGGRQCDVPIAGWDLLPTLSDLAGYKGKLPDTVDGESIRPLLAGAADEIQRKAKGLVFHYFGNSHSAFRAGDYKLVKFWKTGKTELYNLKNDLGERADLASAMPGKVAELEQLLMEYIREVGAEQYTKPDDLEKNFVNPPAAYSLLPFWSWNGTLTPSKITWQIDQMLEKGVKGAFLHPRSGLDESETPYFSEGYWKAFDAAVSHSAATGFQACLYDEDKWPSGSAGGRTVAANPDEFIKKSLFYSKMEVVGPQTVQLNMHDSPQSIFAGQISDKGVYNYATQVNLTHLSGNTWEVPEGRWAIITFMVVKDPHEQIDYLDSAAVAKFIEITHEAYFKRYGSHFGTTIPGIFFDEIYANSSKLDNNIFWTDDFLQQFKKIKGYDLDELLPLIIFKDPQKSSKVRYDYFDVVKDLYVKAWFKQYADWCEAHHIWATGHTAEKLLHYKREADYFATIGQLQVPGTDNEDYRYGFPRFVDWYNIKQISSIGNIFDRKRVMVEALGSGGYGIPLDEYRYGFSMLGAFGGNMLVPHLFHYATDSPGSQSDWPPSWFFENPYWKYFKPLAVLGNRLSYMIAQGTEVCDVAILYPLTDLWEGGYPDHIDDIFYKEVQNLLLKELINFNIIDPESLAGATVADGKIRKGKGAYSVLILPALQYIRTDVADRITAFVENGGKVIALRTIPALSETGPPQDERVAVMMERLFGFPPHALRPGEYYHWDKEQANQYTSKTNQQHGTAVFTRFLDQLPGIIHDVVTPDILVKTDNRYFLQFHHRKIDGKDVFLFVNDRNREETYHISLQNAGAPATWHPETGEVKPFYNYRMNEDRMEMLLSFKPRESYFLVLESGLSNNYDGLIDDAGWEDMQIEKMPDRMVVEGWRVAKSQDTVAYICGEQHLAKHLTNEQTLPELAIDGEFQFQLAPHALDYRWDSSLENDTLELPVMQFHAERTPDQGRKERWFDADFDDSRWNTVKIFDVYNKKPGVQRYLSGWDAWWIRYYDNTIHLRPLPAGDYVFRKEFQLPDKAKEAVVAITADKAYELFVNGRLACAGRQWETVETVDIAGYLQPGANIVEVKTNHTNGVLFQGTIRLKNGKTIPVRSDDSWLVASGQTDWRNALCFALPNMGPWGRIRNPLQELKYPVTVWYRQQLPPGVTAVCAPSIKGTYDLFVNGTLVKPVKEGGVIDFRHLLKKNNNVIAVKAVAGDETCGLLQPLQVLCGKSSQPLISWNEMGLNWYSGRAVYTKNVHIPARYVQPATRLMLDLGKVNYFAEIWVNGQLVRYYPWGPFNADVTDYVKPGDNTVTVVVANLLINQANWNILDDNINDNDSRWWHDGSISRESEKLESGLFGPLKIIPLSKQKMSITYTVPVAAD